MKNIIYGASKVGLLDSIYITVVSMCLVFLVLMLISAILSFFKYIPKDVAEKKQTAKKPVKKVDEAKFDINLLNDEEKLVASLVSIIACSEEENVEDIRLRSIKLISE